MVFWHLYFCFVLKFRSVFLSAAPPSKSPCCSGPSSVAPSPTFPRCADSPPSSDTSLHRQFISRQQSPCPDTDGSCYTELCPGPQSFVERLRVEEGRTELDQDANAYFCPVVETVSSFRPSRYQSTLMPTENKPLEVGILRRVKEVLGEVDPRTAAKHITKSDCMVRFTTYPPPIMGKRFKCQLIQ